MSTLIIIESRENHSSKIIVDFERTLSELEKEQSRARNALAAGVPDEHGESSSTLSAVEVNSIDLFNRDRDDEFPPFSVQLFFVDSLVFSFCRLWSLPI